MAKQLKVENKIDQLKKGVQGEKKVITGMRIELEAPQQKIIHSKKIEHRDFPCSPMVKNQPCNAGDISLIPGRRAKIPLAAEQLSPSFFQTKALDISGSDDEMARPKKPDQAIKVLMALASW